MPSSRESPPRGAPGASPLEESRRLFREAERFDAAHESDRHLEALKRFLAHVEEHRKDLDEGAVEVAHDLDRASMAFYQRSQAELALRAVEVGLSLESGSASLLHHKALVLLALNRQVDQAIGLLDKSLEANPHDKRVWATKGDALKLLGRNPEAAEAYLAAQRLDATSSQYVDRALKLDPSNSVGLRMKLQLARSGGGEQQALEAAEALLASDPGDPELLLEKARLLATLGQLQPALEALQPVAAVRPDDPHVRFLRGRLLFAMGRLDEAVPIYQTLVEGQDLLDGVALAEIAGDLEKNGHQPDLALAARQRVRELDPQNVANLQALRTAAIARNQNDIAIEASRAILQASPHNLDAERSLLDLLVTSAPFDDALSTGREILQDHPTEVVELKRVLHAAQAAARPEIVLEFAVAILKVEGEDTETQAALAAALAQTGATKRALELYEHLSEREPNETRYLLERRQLLVDLDRAPELVPVLDALFRLDPTRYDVALERGNLYLSAAYEFGEGSAERESAARDAMVSYERATLDPTLRSAAQLGVARASRLVHDHPRAVKAYREFLNDPEFDQRADVMKEFGDVLREMDRQNEAREVYEKAVSLGLEDVDLFFGLVETLSRLNQESRALRYVDLLLQREPTNPVYLRRKGQLLLKAGRRAEGLIVLKSAVQAAKGDAHAYFEIAEALRAQGTYADAVTYYQEGLHLDPKSRAGQLGLAETYEVGGRFTDALPMVDQLLHEEPNDLRAWKIRADVHRSLGHDGEVIYSLKAIVLLDPHNASALGEMYRLQAKKGQKLEAFDSLTDLLSAGGSEAEDPAIWIEHGDLAGDLGKTDESNRSYERAQQLDPSQALEIVTRRARVRLLAGRPDLALEILSSIATPDVASAPERSTPYLLLRAQVLLSLERPADARTAYEAIRTVTPGSPEATQGVARSLLDEGKPTEAREFLRSVLPTQPPQAEVFLLLSEAEAGLGSLPFATEVVRRGVEALPKSGPLWLQLGELHVRQETWDKAADAYAHAIALDRSNAEVLLRAGFVAEKLGHGHEALTLYNRATELAPGNKYAWSSRGVALLSVGRPEEARASFDRALALDSDFEAAKEGRKAAQQRTRDATIEMYGREGLLLEARLNRTITKNDLFVTLHVPFDVLDPVLQVLARSPRVDIDRLSDQEMQDLEVASYHLVTSALQNRPAGIESRGLTLADVAALAPPTYSLTQIQRLFGYLHSALEMDLRPENLHLTPDVEELARKALLLPAEQRSLFQLVQILRVGVFKARVIKTVETAGRAVHAPLPALDLGAYTPEFRGTSPAALRSHVTSSGTPHPGATVVDDEIPFPETPRSSPASHTTRPPPPAGAGIARCVGCGGIASVMHVCGAPLCQHCIAQFPSCPKCGEPVTSATTTPLEHAAAPRPAARERRFPPINPFRSLTGRPKAEPDETTERSDTRPTSAGSPETRGHSGAHAPTSRSDPPNDSHPGPVHSAHTGPGHPAAGGAPAEDPSAPHVAKPRPKPDEEPRL
ncbi:MAG: tetratricopeptide repeat protein [Thermoplasmata archaeon]|nr:tetratricopeptide repeat protein [Thermoplasmata archaeon]